MTFKSIVWKMTKANYQKYVLYFLCNAFTVMFLFMFATVYFNTGVEKVKQLQSLESALAIPGAALVIFTLFFIQYVHNIFIKRRNSEFGLFMSIGMSPRDIGKLLQIESAIISFAAVIVGLVGGVLFSRLFFLGLVNAVGLQGVSYTLTVSMFLYTVLAFLVIFWFTVVKSYYTICQRNYLQTLQSNQVAETIKTRNPLYGLIGIVMLVMSVMGLYFTYEKYSEFLFMYAFLTFIGAYLCISSFASFLIESMKKGGANYYRFILFFSSIEYKLNRFTSIMLLVTMMMMITILYSTIILFTAKEQEQKIMAFHPFDIAFLQTDTKNNIVPEQLGGLLNSKNNHVTEHLILPIYEYDQPTSDNPNNVYKFIAIEDFNQLTSRQMTLSENEFIYFINGDPQYTGETQVVDEIMIDNLKLTQKDRIVESRINYVGHSGDYIVVHSRTKKRLTERLDGRSFQLHLINMENWKDSLTVVEELQKVFTKNNRGMSDSSSVSEDTLFEISSKVEDYERSEAQNGILFYVMVFISIIFFLGSFVLLYANLFADIEKEQRKYQKLYQIGITLREMKRIISMEVSVIFFAPICMGTALALLYIIAMAQDVGGILQNLEVLKYFTIITCAYYIIQLSFFRYARKKLFMLLLHS